MIDFLLVVLVLVIGAFLICKAGMDIADYVRLKRKRREVASRHNRDLS